MTYDELLQGDLAHLWHPFTPQDEWERHAEPLIIDRADGFELIDAAGRRVIDGVSSIWCNVHGHNVHYLNRAIAKELESVSHVTMLGMSSRAIVEAGLLLSKVLPEGLDRIFFADSGTAAVEAALRMCLEWCQKSSHPQANQRTKYASLRGGYHGDTLGSVGVGYVEEFHRTLSQAVIPSFKVPPPHIFRFYQGMGPDEAERAAIKAVEELFATHGHELAAFIVEPFVQGPAGIWIHSEGYLKAIEQLARTHDVFLIADEVAVGFGKTGSMFACERAGIKPDVLVLGKGLSGGYLPISAAVTHERMFAGFRGALEERKTFYYGQTFAGNCLGAGAIKANLELLEKNAVLAGLEQRIQQFHQQLKERVAPLQHVDEVRMFGVMVGIELTAVPGKREAYPIGAQAARRVSYEAIRRGAFIRPVGNVVTLCPAIAMPEELLERLVQITAEALEQVLGA